MASIFKTVDKGEGLVAVLEHMGVAVNRNKLGWQKINCFNVDAHAGGQDRTPSCGVNLTIGWVHCFSCGYRGDWANIANDILGLKVDKAVDLLGLKTGGKSVREGDTDSDYFLF